MFNLKKKLNNLLKKHEPTIIADFLYDKGKLTFVGEHCESMELHRHYFVLHIILINSDITSPPFITITN